MKEENNLEASKVNDEGAKDSEQPPKPDLTAIKQEPTQRQKLEQLAKLSQSMLNASQDDQKEKTKQKDQKIDQLNELKWIQMNNSLQKYRECAYFKEHLQRQNVVQKHKETALKEVEQIMDQKQEQKKEAVLNAQKALAGDRPFDGMRGVGGMPSQGLQSLKQNQNLFLSLQSKEDKLNRWKYTLLVLDNMIDQIMGRGPYRGYDQGFWGQSPNLQTTIGGSGPIRVNQNGVRVDQDENEVAEMQDGEIDFVKIAENLPKLAILAGPRENTIQSLAIGDKKQSSSGRNAIPNKTLLKASDAAGRKVQRISLQPRICSKLWEALRKSLKESFKMELEFFDHTRQELMQNFHVEALLMFQRRLQVYLANHGLLTLKQVQLSKEGRKFFEEELRAQRLVETFCNMCEKAESSGLSTRYKMTFMQIGQSLREELKKTDKDNLTEKELNEIRAACNDAVGEQGALRYNDLDQVLNKIYREVNVQHKKRKTEVLGGNEKSLEAKWTNTEIAQLLVAVFNMGEGEWAEIQKRLNFQSSGVVKTPNQVAYRWRQIKRLKKRDMKKIRKSLGGTKIVTKHEWILYTLRQIIDQDPTIDIKPEHLQVLENSLLINPNTSLTPYQQIIQKFHRDQYALHEQRQQKQQRIQQKQSQKIETVPQINLKPLLEGQVAANPVVQQQAVDPERKERAQLPSNDGSTFQKPFDKMATGAPEDLKKGLTEPLQQQPPKNSNTINTQTIVKSQEIQIKEQLIKNKILASPGKQLQQQLKDKSDAVADPFDIQKPASQLLSGPNKLSQGDSVDAQNLLKQKNVSSNNTLQPKITNMQQLSGLKDHKLTDAKLLKTSSLVGQKRDYTESQITSALNIAKTVQQSSIHQIQPGPRNIQALTQRLRESEIAAQQNSKLDLNIEDANMINKINDEIMASVTSGNLKLGKNNQKGVLGTNASGLPGNTSVMNSNENSSNSGPNTQKQQQQQANKQSNESQHVQTIQTSQRIGPSDSRHVVDSQMNQQITINNNISITTIHNHEQSEKGVNQKVQYTASNMPAKTDERIARAPRAGATANISSTAQTSEAEAHPQGLRGLQLQNVLNNLSQGQPQHALHQQQMQSVPSYNSTIQTQPQMTKKQSYGLLINNPLNNVQAPTNPTRNQGQYGAMPNIVKNDSIHNLIRNQSLKSEQSLGGQGYMTGQMNSGKLRDHQQFVGRQPGTPGQHIPTATMQKNPAQPSYQVNAGGISRMGRENIPGHFGGSTNQVGVTQHNLSGKSSVTHIGHNVPGTHQNKGPVHIGLPNPHQMTSPNPVGGVQNAEIKKSNPVTAPGKRLMSSKQYLLYKTMNKNKQHPVAKPDQK